MTDLKNSGDNERNKNLLEELKKKANSNDPEAAAKLGLKYFYGKGVKQNDNKAKEFLKIASDADDITGTRLFSLRVLSSLYCKKKDYVKSIKCYEKGIALGDPASAFSLAEYYAKGDRVKKNMGYAYKLLDKALNLYKEQLRQDTPPQNNIAALVMGRLSEIIPEGLFHYYSDFKGESSEDHEKRITDGFNENVLQYIHILNKAAKIIAQQKEITLPRAVVRKNDNI